jgi:hypothetical protein
MAWEQDAREPPTRISALEKTRGRSLKKDGAPQVLLRAELVTTPGVNA